jgi:hypothetical protein
MNKTIIVDLDGTLALNNHRFHFIDKSLKKKVDWDSYFNACNKDQPNIPIIETIKALKEQGFSIHILSARGDVVREKTIRWLETYNVPYDKLTMREMNSYTPDEELKKSWLIAHYPNYKADVFCVFDDRDRVVKMWRSMGLVCLQVAEGNF